MRCIRPRPAPSLQRAQAAAAIETGVAMEHDGIRIGQLAKLLGTTTKTLRFYEDISLLKSAQRSGSGYRL